MRAFEHTEPLKLSREVASIEAAAVAASNAHRKSLYKLDIPAGIVPTLIVTILRHARDVSARVLSLRPGARNGPRGYCSSARKSLKVSPSILFRDRV